MSSSPAIVSAVQLIADKQNGSKRGLNGGEYTNTGPMLAEAAVIAAGAGYQIDANGLNINVPDSMASSIEASVYVSQGAGITLSNSALTNSRVLASGSGSKLTFNSVSVTTPNAGNAIMVKDRATAQLNGVTVGPDNYLAVMATNGANVEINNLRALSGIYLSASTGNLRHSRIDTASNVGVGVVNDKSNLLIEDSTIYGKAGGITVTNEGTLTFKRGEIKSDGNALVINQDSAFSGSNVSIIAGRQAIQALAGSSVKLDGFSRMQGQAGIYADGVKLDFTDVQINTLGVNVGHGIWLQNLDDLCASGCETATLNRVNIDTMGTVSHGLYFTVGAKADIDNSAIATHGDRSIGIYVAGSSSSYSPSALKLTNSSVTTDGVRSRGIMVRNYTDSGRITSELDSVNVLTQGESSAALVVWEGSRLNGTNVIAKTTGLDSPVLDVAGGSAIKRNTVTLTGGSLTSTQNVGVVVDGFSDISLSNMSVSGTSGFVTAEGLADATVALNRVNADGDTSVLSGGRLNMTLDNASYMKGRVNGASVSLIDTASIWDVAGDSTVNSLNNSGHVRFTDPGSATFTGRTLTVNGDYVGHGGTLTLYSQLSDDISATDSMVVIGNTRGQTYLAINNAGGLGGETVDGIRVISVAGQSDGRFSLNGRVGYGGYEYFLHQGDSTGNGGDWYLRSEYSITPPSSPTPTPQPVPAPQPQPATPTPPVYPNSRPVIEPEVGIYAGNQTVANTLFNLRLHDRIGEAQFSSKGDRSVNSAANRSANIAESMWLRVVGSHEKSHVADDRLRLQTNASLVQLGGDVALWSTNGQDRGHLGAMAGYGNAHLTSASQQSGYSAKSQIDGYSVGLYATWYANQDLKQSGLYVDSWVQHSWFNNDVSADRRSTINYDAKGVSASIETGYTQKVSEFSNGTWFVQPQAQIIWSGVRADKVDDGRGSAIDSDNQDYWQSRIGLRTYLQGTSPANRAQIFQPFIEASWLHNSHGYGVDYRTDRGSRHYESDTSRDIAEVKTGVEGKISNSLTLWGNIGHQFDAQHYQRTEGTLGVKYQF
ncbi:autotransporter outer membrane beta-barrel domain-containing protein [Budvicia diplopodorum]|uniref:autotransporter outer membrane beta-barrel domain-containing protein n=1 Tax=Budvicia diplopodorum TaxID=1119056 RepID=UPI00135C0AE0|nr:autotransporter outer membrane beta-barrel domain-containing protein [Budvicia diplopodorum]